MPQDQKNATYLVTLDTGTEGTATYQVSAAHLKTDDHFFPGFVQMLDEDKNLVAIANASRALLIRCRESDPTFTPRADAAVPSVPRGPVPRPPHTPASRAQLAQLAGRGGKPGDV